MPGEGPSARPPGTVATPRVRRPGPRYPHQGAARPVSPRCDARRAGRRRPDQEEHECRKIPTPTQDLPQAPPGADVHDRGRRGGAARRGRAGCAVRGGAPDERRAGGADRGGPGVVRRVRRPRRDPSRPGQVESGGQRRRRRQQRAAVLHRQHRQRRPRRQRPHGHHRPQGQPRRLPVPLRAVRVHLGPHEHGGQVHPGLRQVRGPHQDPARPGDLAGLLDAGRQLRLGRLARQRRDRHHGERRPRAEHRARHPARPRLLGRQPDHRLLPAPQRGSVRRRLPHLRGGVGPRLDHLVRRRRRLPDVHPADTAATRGSTTTRSS